MEQIYRTRADPESVTPTDDGFLVEGNLFDDEDLREVFAEGDVANITAFSGSAREPRAFPAGETAEVDDGACR